MDGVTVLHGHVLDQLSTLTDASVQMCWTSPPYWGLRDYGLPPVTWPDGWEGQLGLEPTPQLYVQHLVEIFREVRRVLAPSGTLWLNLGDSRNNPPPGNKAPMGKTGLHGAHTSETYRTRLIDTQHQQQRARRILKGLKPKDLVGIPWMTAFALRDDGWYLRSDIVWAKGVSGQKELTSTLRTAMKKAHLTPDQIHRTLAHMEPYIGNCMPESVKDRPTQSHEYLFLLTKSAKAYCDMNEVQEESVELTRPQSEKRRQQRMARGVVSLDGVGQTSKGVDGGAEISHVMQTSAGGRRNRRSVWLVPPIPFKGAHFATAPPNLIEPCIRAGTSPHGQCAACGKPWVATRVKGEPNVEQQRASGADAAGGYHGEGQKDYAAGLAQNPSDVKRRILEGMRATTTTWGPSCGCGAPSVGQIVLDPFGGSGTAAAVAKRLGRRAITIELNPEYLSLIAQRVAKGR